MTSPNKIKTIQIGHKKWKVIEDFYFYSATLGKTIHIPAGFTTDYASVPWPFILVISRRGKHGTAAVIHDFLYRYQPCDRVTADTVMFEKMLIDNVKKAKREAIYLGIRLGGWKAWNRRKKQLKDKGNERR